jgi:hypothetical protein
MSTFKLRGHRVLLTRPAKKDLGLVVSKEMQEELIIEELQNMKSLSVFAVGDEVTDVFPGDLVLVPTSTLMHAEVVKVDDQDRIMVRAMDIAIIW